MGIVGQNLTEQDVKVVAEQSAETPEKYFDSTIFKGYGDRVRVGESGPGYGVRKSGGYGSETIYNPSVFAEKSNVPDISFMDTTLIITMLLFIGGWCLLKILKFKKMTKT